MTVTWPIKIGLAGCTGAMEVLGLHEAIDRIVAAEADGLDGVWVNEEHLAGQRRFQNSGCPSALTFLTFVAARTTRMRLGTTVLLLPLHHPLRLAEETATLQALSKGRVHLGISPGHNGNYFDAYGIDASCRYDDYDTTVDVLQRLWAGEEVDFNLSQFHGRNASLSILPPTPPKIYRGAYSDSSLRAAAEAQIPLAQHLIQSPASLRHGRDVYREFAPDPALAETLLRESPVSRFVFVADSDAEAEKKVDRHAVSLSNRLKTIGIHQRVGITTVEALDPVTFKRENAIWGSPETVATWLRGIASELGNDTFNCNLSWFGHTEADEVSHGFELLTKEVIPRVQNVPARSR